MLQLLFNTVILYFRPSASLLVCKSSVTICLHTRNNNVSIHLSQEDWHKTIENTNHNGWKVHFVSSTLVEAVTEEGTPNLALLKHLEYPVVVRPLYNDAPAHGNAFSSRGSNRAFPSWLFHDHTHLSAFGTISVHAYNSKIVLIHNGSICRPEGGRSSLYSSTHRKLHGLRYPDSHTECS